ncbi:MAG: glycosyltransferase family 4 protein [Actinobacteria bacterium]|nr:glycosyltransferase family 4 protein [Actinomycetota bacterium]
MDIAVCGAQKLYMRGGAELHQDNLVAALEAAGHRAELVRLPVAWEKGRIFDSPLAWRMIPVDADLVIATNFPSYFVRHPNKVVWLLHQQRSAYDGADSRADWSDFGLDDVSLEEQRQLVEWDNIALSEAREIFTTSDVVADRLARYNGLKSTTLYHPPPLAGQLHPGEAEDFILAVNRFDANKRPGLIVEAMAHETSGVRAVSVGRGVLLDELRARTEQLGLADRVALPGFVRDEELIDLFARCLGVLYAPADEDYGYVTVQAFLAGKPVITAIDSGGVLEWVEDGVTGFVTDGSPRELGRAFDRLAADPAKAREMGAEARRRVADLSWATVVERLTSA